MSQFLIITVGLPFWVCGLLYEFVLDAFHFGRFIYLSETNTDKASAILAEREKS